MTADTPTPDIHGPDHEGSRWRQNTAGQWEWEDDDGQWEVANHRDIANDLVPVLAAEIERLQTEVNLARSGDIPHLLGMLEAFDRPAPKFIQENQDRWREALSDDR